MALDVYFREDIANAIRSAGLVDTPPNVVELLESNVDRSTVIGLIQAYQHGHADALREIGAAFGVFVGGNE